MQDLAGFVVKSVNQFLDDKEPRIEVVPDVHGNYKRRCSCCGRSGRVHDKLRERRWHYVPLWNIPVHLRCAPRRVICPVTGAPTVEAMPWNLRNRPYAVASSKSPANLQEYFAAEEVLSRPILN